MGKNDEMSSEMGRFVCNTVTIGRNQPQAISKGQQLHSDQQQQRKIRQNVRRGLPIFPLLVGPDLPFFGQFCLFFWPILPFLTNFAPPLFSVVVRKVSQKSPRHFSPALLHLSPPTQLNVQKVSFGRANGRGARGRK